MKNVYLATMETKFADIVWANAPITSSELVRICGEELNWARTTTYTVLKKVCSRGIFKLEKKMVTVLIPKDEFYAIQSENFVNKDFSGSLPAFLAAFTSRRKLSEKDISEIRKMLDSYTEK